MLGYEGESIRVVSRKRLNPAEPNAGHVVKKFKKLENIGKKPDSKIQFIMAL